MFEHSLFYLVFLSQILLISYYYPRKFLKRMSFVLETYPPSKYPKLYPKSIEFEQRGQRNFRLMNRGILGIGVLLLVGLVVANYNSGGNILREVPIFFGMFQFLPLFIIEISGFNQFKLMRKADTSKTRTAVLETRRLVDFVSPALIGVAVCFYILCIVFDLYVHQFDVYWGHDTIQRAIILTMGNLLFGGIIFWNLHGQKQNPHQAHKDRVIQMRIAAKSLVLVSILVSLYFMTISAADKFNLEPFESSLASIYFQMMAIISVGSMLQLIQSSDVDFDVYKADSLAPGTI